MALNRGRDITIPSADERTSSTLFSDVTIYMSLLTMQGGTAEAEYAATDFAPPGDISSVTRSCGDIKKFISDTLCDKGPSENSTNFHRV